MHFKEAIRRSQNSTSTIDMSEGTETDNITIETIGQTKHEAYQMANGSLRCTKCLLEGSAEELHDLPCEADLDPGDPQ